MREKGRDFYNYSALSVKLSIKKEHKLSQLINK